MFEGSNQNVHSLHLFIIYLSGLTFWHVLDDFNLRRANKQKSSEDRREVGVGEEADMTAGPASDESTPFSRANPTLASADPLEAAKVLHGSL